jgi:hypothetical protein
MRLSAVLVWAFERTALLAYDDDRLANHRSVVVRGDGRNSGDWLSPVRVLKGVIHSRSVQRVYPICAPRWTVPNSSTSVRL